MNWLTFLISSLATFRLAELFAYDAGPFDLLVKLRSSLRSHPNLHGLVSCVYCLGIHFSFWITLLLVLIGEVTLAVSPIYWLGVAGLAVVIGRVIRER